MDSQGPVFLKRSTRSSPSDSRGWVDGSIQTEMWGSAALKHTGERDGWKLIKVGACSEWRVARAALVHSERRQLCPVSLVQTAPSTPRLLCASPPLAQPPTAYQWSCSPVCANGNYNMGSFVLRDNGWAAMRESRVMQCGVLMTAGLMGPQRAGNRIERKVSRWARMGGSVVMPQKQGVTNPNPTK